MRHVMNKEQKINSFEQLSADPIFEIKYLADAIDQLNKEPLNVDTLERIRTLELCLLAAARKLAA